MCPFLNTDRQLDVDFKRERGKMTLPYTHTHATTEKMTLPFTHTRHYIKYNTTIHTHKPLQKRLHYHTHTTTEKMTLPYTHTPLQMR